MLVLKQYEEEAKAVLAFVLAVIIGILIYTVWSWYNAAHVNEATVTELSHTAQATSAVTSEASAATQEAQQVDIVVHQARDTYATQYQKALSTDAAAATWDSTPIPDSLRNAARARRLAHDGPADASAGGAHPN